MTCADRSRVLLVEPAASTRHEIAASLITQLNVHLSTVTCGADALECDMVAAHEVAVVSLDIDDMNGLELVRQLQQIRRRPIVITAQEAVVETVLPALRLGAVDFLSHPIHHPSLVESLKQGLKGQRTAARSLQRGQRVRTLLRRMIHERRELQQRIDLLCRDLVGAHQRLVRRLADSDTRRSA